MSSQSLCIRGAAMGLLLLLTGLVLARRGGQELVVSHQRLTHFPESLGTWRGRVVEIDPRVAEILGAGDFAERVYQRSVYEPQVDLFLGYFPSQRTGVSIHSPRNCLPGSGWAPIEAKYVTLIIGRGRDYQVNEYVIQKGEQKQLVLYWYQTHGRLIANEYAAKAYLIADSIRMNRSDAALVRIITPIVTNESALEAEKRGMEFARTLIPNLKGYIPT